MSKYLICSSESDKPIYLANDLNSALLWIRNAFKSTWYVSEPNLLLYQISDSSPLAVHFVDNKVFID